MFGGAQLRGPEHPRSRATGDHCNWRGSAGGAPTLLTTFFFVILVPFVAVAPLQYLP